jgi:hypothetical protein
VTKLLGAEVKTAEEVGATAEEKAEVWTAEDGVEVTPAKVWADEDATAGGMRVWPPEELVGAACDSSVRVV